MSKRIDFFATGDDLASVLRAVEQRTPLKYCEMAFYAPAEKFRCVEGGAKIEALSVADSPSSIACRTWLVSSVQTLVRGRTIARHDGSSVVVLDQLDNPDTVTLTPAGEWQASPAILAGSVATASETEESKGLLKLFQRELSERFARVKGLFVGRCAWSARERGARLTMSIDSPEDYDLDVAGVAAPWRA